MVQWTLLNSFLMEFPRGRAIFSTIGCAPTPKVCAHPESKSARRPNRAAACPLAKENFDGQAAQRNNRARQSNGEASAEDQNSRMDAELER
jgi:hypothetical protein